MQTPPNFSSLKRYGHTLLAGLVICVTFLPSAARAIAISLDLGQPPKITSAFTTSFNALNGMSLGGQNLSLDFTFSNAEFVRLFTITSGSFSTLITLQTNGNGIVGFLDGTGFLSDQNGNPLLSPQMLGRASENDGSMTAALFPFFSNQLQRPVDFYDVHFDLTLPVNLSVSITGAQFALDSQRGRPIGIGPGVPTDIVPDDGSTLLLFSLALLAPIAVRSNVIAPLLS